MPLAALAVIQTGGYVSPWKVGIILVLLIIWAKLLTWIDKDSVEARLNRELVNSIMMAGLVGGYLLFFLISGFGPAIGVLISLFVVTLAIYLTMRSRTIGLGDLKKEFSDWWHGLLSSGRKKQVKAAVGQVLIMDKSGAAEPPPAEDTPEFLQYESAQLFLTKPLRLGAEALDMVAGEPPVVTYHVDGMKYDGDAMDRNRAGAAVQYLKRMAGLDMNERRKPQTGTFRALMDGKKYTIQITSLGSASGESLKLITNPKDRQNFKLDAMGFSEEQLATIRASKEGGGLVLLGTPRGQGLTSLCYAMVRDHDAFLFHVHTIERAPDFDMEGITQNALPANASPAEEAKLVNWVISQEPDVLMVTSVEDSKSAQDLSKAAVDPRRIYVGMRAGSTLDALKQWRKLVGDDSLALKNLKMLIVGRLVRRLCAACKVGYTPDPTTLKKLNMNPDEVGKLYQARKEPMRDAKGNVVPCTFCNDLAFSGRFGIYEVMLIDDEIRSVIKAGGADNQIKQAQRKQRAKMLQDVALAQVRAGETSVEEVLRVLKPDSESGGSAQRPSRGSPPAAPPSGPSSRGAAPRSSAPPSRGNVAPSRERSPQAPQSRPAGP
ncbi:MAG TPA: ATPase, T2SS/T4P/T4SS family [Tepidisphaeraceae bacterium]|jgi:type II secretory ATPase GspE/PulE/Tfp pilus assembly ATPase PilB-like protein